MERAGSGALKRSLAPHDVCVRIRAYFNDSPDAAVGDETLYEMIASALQSVYGVVGGAVPFELHSTQPGSPEGIIKVHKSDLQKLLVAAPFMTAFGESEQSCRLEVLGHSPDASSLGTEGAPAGET
ncbi:unnamed protein product [Pedinophyceae sp. YPF-701]|nr:unnamed protein product [Pedinophyceae sp. YPF-701]